MRRPLALVALVAVVALAACSDIRGTERERTTGARITAENAVLIASRVPQSVVFRNERVILRGKASTVCGEFNGRNTFGRMAGFTRFIYSAGQLSFEDREADFARRWQDACAST
jgi:hypothetical protein